MPELRCDARSCVHNQNNLCELDKVVIGGDDAESARETCCSSFSERTGSMDNCCGDRHAAVHSEIECQARDCRSNQMCRCHARTVSVQGRDACCSRETCCSSFRC